MIAWYPSCNAIATILGKPFETFDQLACYDINTEKLIVQWQSF